MSSRITHSLPSNWTLNWWAMRRLSNCCHSCCQGYLSPSRCKNTSERIKIIRCCWRNQQIFIWRERNPANWLLRRGREDTCSSYNPTKIKQVSCPCRAPRRTRQGMMIIIAKIFPWVMKIKDFSSVVKLRRWLIFWKKSDYII